jgi:lysophospholipase L1-like esterase
MKNLKTMGKMRAVLTCICLTLTLTVAAQHDWANTRHYAAENASLKPEKGRVVFLGNSITWGWAMTHPNFFRDNHYIGRGISGQTTYQFLIRFRPDVIALKPAVVVINAGTNDVAENTDPYNEEVTFGNIVSMVELARANHIKVVLTSVLPAANFRWRPAITDVAEKIASLNARLKAYAATLHIPYVDYYAAMVTGAERALNPAYCEDDGVHPVAAGYDVMEALVKPVVEKLR